MILWGRGGMVYTGDLKSLGSNVLRVRVPPPLPFGLMMELVDMKDSKSFSFGSVGSSPTQPTTKENAIR